MRDGMGNGRGGERRRKIPLNGGVLVEVVGDVGELDAFFMGIKAIAEVIVGVVVEGKDGERSCESVRGVCVGGNQCGVCGFELAVGIVGIGEVLDFYLIAPMTTGLRGIQLIVSVGDFINFLCDFRAIFFDVLSHR